MIMETERLIFRNYTLDDFEQLYQMTRDPDVVRFIGDGKPWTRERALQMLQRSMQLNEEGKGLFACIRKEDGRYIGHSGIVPQEVEGKQEMEIGYWIQKQFWGQGYGLEQAQAWKQYGFQMLNADRLVSLIQAGNTASRRIAEKNGMKLEKTVNFKGKTVCLYSISR